MQNDFVMLINGDSVIPVICQKIENGKSGSYEYLMAFEKENLQKKEDDFTVFYHDKIFGMGTIAFVYDQNDIKNTVLKKLKPTDETIDEVSKGNCFAFIFCNGHGAGHT